MTLSWISKWFNYIRGGDKNEYYCSRIYREGKINAVLFWNLVFFVLNSNDINHCKRVSERGRK